MEWDQCLQETSQEQGTGGEQLFEFELFGVSGVKYDSVEFLLKKHNFFDFKLHKYIMDSSNFIEVYKYYKLANDPKVIVYKLNISFGGQQWELEKRL